MQNSKKGSIVLGLLFIIFVLVLGRSWYVYTQKNKTFTNNVQTVIDTASSTNVSTIATASTTSSVAPEIDGRQAYPTTNRATGNLVLYYLDDGSTKDIGEKGWVETYAGIGPTNLSWSEFFTAYIRNAPGGTRNSPQIVIINHKTLEKKVIYSAEKNKAIMHVRWSPNDEKIIWEIGDINLNAGEGDDGVQNVRAMVYDVETQKVSVLPSGMGYSGSFIDDDRLVVYKGAKFEIFNLDTNAIEPGAYEKELGFMQANSPIFQFSADGKRVHMSGWAKPPEGAGLKYMDNVLGDMNTKSFIRVSSLETFVSSSSFAPNGKSVAYSQRRPGTNPGIDEVVVYDVASQKKTTVGVGYPFRWIDDNRFVFYTEGGEKAEFYLYDISQNSATKMVGVNW